MAAAPLLPSATSLPAQAEEPRTAAKAIPLPITRTLAEWVVASRPADIPAAVRKEAVRSIVNVIGATVGGSSDPTIATALRAITPYSGPARAALFGRSERLDGINAAVVNGISSHVLDFDDTELSMVIHPAGVVAFALLGLAADHPITGADFLHAFILGTEVESRIGRAIYPTHYDVGFHITATTGVFGAAAACGKILGLDTQKMVYALGTAAVQSAGLQVAFGSMGKAFQVGRAAGNGLFAARLAEQGFTSSDASLEGFNGYFTATTRQRNDTAAIANLGQYYEISQNTYKPFPCGIVIHPVLDAAIQLYKENHIPAEQIASVTIKGNPLILQLTGKKTPQTGLEGKFSVFHSTAIALIRGHVGLAEYSTPAVLDPAVVALRSRVEVLPDAAIPSDQVFVTLKTRDGRTFDKHIEHAIGSVERPMTNADLDEKFRGLADGILTKPQASKLLAMCWSVESLPDVATLATAGARSA